jgi:hypothetical protein
MRSAALRAPRTSDAALGHVAFKAAHTLLAIGVAGAAIFAAPSDGTLALDRFAGGQFLLGHGIAHALGNESISAAGSPTGAAGWLGAVAVAAIAAMGGAVATFVAVLAALVTFALVERRARRMAGPVFGLAAASLGFACAIGSFGFAGGIVTAAFAVALAEVLDWPGTWSALLATALAVVWCNVAPQGLFAPALAFVFALGARLEAHSDAEQRRRWLAFGGTALALFATPGLLAYPAVALEDLRLDQALTDIVQYHPADVALLAYRTGFLLALCAAYALGLRQKRAGDVLLFAAAGLLALANGSYLPVFGVLVAPLLAASAAATFALRDRDVATPRGDLLVAVASVLAAAVLATSLAPRDLPVAPAFGLAASLAGDGRPHRLLCLNVEWCDAALANGAKTSVFMDGRVGAYPPSVRQAQLNVVHMREGWRRTLATYRIDAILARKDRAFSTLVALTPGWKAVASDELAVLYERTPVR